MPLTPESEKEMSPTERRDAHDDQLQRALDLLASFQGSGTQ